MTKIVSRIWEIHWLRRWRRACAWSDRWRSWWEVADLVAVRTLAVVADVLLIVDPPFLRQEHQARDDHDHEEEEDADG